MDNRSIAESVQALAGTQLGDTVRVFDATVDEVQVESRTCTVTAISGKDPVTIPGVRLMADIDDGILLIPAIGSTVSVITSTYGDPYVSCYSEIDSISLRGGDLGGLVKIAELTEKLNKIEKDINTLKNAFRSWIVLPSDGGAALKASAASWSAQDLEETERLELENLNITQG